ncbi:hypothetical protein, partial [Bacillus licheniformis]|uniref:hypothetical protein n=1 Tax=Bacillus licheniformis TaxID=1402 RepID=UPI0034A06D88
SKRSTALSELNVIRCKRKLDSKEAAEKNAAFSFMNHQYERSVLEDDGFLSPRIYYPLFSPFQLFE